MLDKGKDKSKIEKYIQLVYAKDSELRTVADFNDRKVKACIKVGLDPEAESSKDIMTLKNELVLDQVFEFLRMNNSLIYVQYISDIQLFWDIQLRKMQPLKSTEDDEAALKSLNLKTTMSERSDELLQRISRLAKEIFQGDKEMEMAEDKVRKLSTPEQRLKQKQA